MKKYVVAIGMLWYVILFGCIPLHSEAEDKFRHLVKLSWNYIHMK
ncbi:hypothetical protein [Virgibacillus dokdonensis]|nr:hypothetical protein [Virgibacillus dokdonensis]